MNRSWIGLVTSFLLLGWSAGCSDGPRVVVYTSVDQVFSEAICEDFQKETGIQVDLVPDTEETKGTGLHNRLIAEKERPRADVFWSGDPVRAADLKGKGISAAYKSPAAEGLPAGLSDAMGHWTCFSARARVIIYNTDLVAEDQKPRSITDLADPRFKGKACIANPMFGTTSMHATALFMVWGELKTKRFFQSLVENEVAILGSNETRIDVVYVRKVEDAGCGKNLRMSREAFNSRTRHLKAFYLLTERN